MNIYPLKVEKLKYTKISNNGQEEEEDGGEDREEVAEKEDGGISVVPQALRLTKRGRK